MRAAVPAGTEAGSGIHGQTAFVPGTVVGGRFRIQAFLRSEGGTGVYQAVDNQGGAPAHLRVIPSPAPPLRVAIETQMGRLACLEHKNLCAILAVGDYAGQLFVATAAEDGHTLRELIDTRRAQGQAIGLAYAQTLLGHIANALEEIYRVTPHGALNPVSIFITRSGRVKVMDAGLTAALPALAWRGGPAGLPEGLYAAPELGQGGSVTAATDVYSLGAILYELATGAAPVPPLKTPSQTVPDMPAGVDTVIGRALSQPPHSRHQTPADLLAELAAAMSGAAVAPRVTSSKSFDVAHAAGMAQTDERWLVQKERLDYGPFSLSHIMAQIERGEFSPDHFVVDVDSGERIRIKEHPLLGEFSVEAARKLEAVRRVQSDHQLERIERKKGRATVFIIGAAVVAIGAGLGIYLKNRKAVVDEVLSSRTDEGDIDAFIKRFKLDVPKRKATARRGSSRGADDFSGVTNLGDVTQGGADEILSDSKIQQVMMNNYRKLVPCIIDERRRNSGLSTIELEFVVLGAGRVPAVRVNGQQKGPFPACVLGKMQSFAFPPYNGKKTIASWSMSMR